MIIRQIGALDGSASPSVIGSIPILAAVFTVGAAVRKNWTWAASGAAVTLLLTAKNYDLAKKKAGG